MMLLPYTEDQQDSIQVKHFQIRDSLGLISDSASISGNIHSKDSVPHRIKTLVVKPVPEISDTISVCRRNSIEDVTFYDPNNLVGRIELPHRDAFPFLFTAKGRLIQEEAKATLVKHLRAGDEIPLRPLHDDWIILIILFSIFLFTIIRKSSDSLFPGVERFFPFRGVNRSRTKGYRWDIHFGINNKKPYLISYFRSFRIFCSCILYIIPSAISGIIFWLISVIIIIAAVSLRHLVCIITGFTSGERELFTEYLLGIYQFYRFSALFLFVVIILISYTTIFPLESCFIAGTIVLGILYLIRIIRLLIIFINRNISIFYLILYLCALEILPVVISVKYFSGLT